MSQQTSVNNEPQQDVEAERDPNSATTFIIGAVGIILLIGTVIGTQALSYFVQTSEIKAKVDVNKEIPDLKSAREEWTIQLAEARWVDRPAGVASIPLDRARKLVLNELKTGTRTAPLPTMTTTPTPAPTSAPANPGH